MPESAAPNPQADVDPLEVAADQAIVACGGNTRDAVKALIVANEYLESEVCELTRAVSHAYTRGPGCIGICSKREVISRRARSLQRSASPSHFQLC
jgi:hypothetical protein